MFFFQVTRLVSSTTGHEKCSTVILTHFFKQRSYSIVAIIIQYITTVGYTAMYLKLLRFIDFKNRNNVKSDIVCIKLP